MHLVGQIVFKLYWVLHGPTFNGHVHHDFNDVPFFLHYIPVKIEEYAIISSFILGCLLDNRSEDSKVTQNH